VTISKVLLVVVAIIAAYVTSLKPGDILFLVAAAFSLAASAFFPPSVLGVFWKRATKWGAIVGMSGSRALHVLHDAHLPVLSRTWACRRWICGLGSTRFRQGIWASRRTLTIIIVSLLTPEPNKETQELVEHVRYPHLRGDIDTQAA
jgi:cation/acetate symporter